MKTVEIIVNTDGSLTIDAKGFQGAECTKATEALRKALGDQTKETNKPERYARTGAAQQKASQ